MRVLVYGLGRSGLAVLRLLERQGHIVEYFEHRESGTDIDEADQLGAVRLASSADTSADLVIAAPGVPIDHPDLNLLRLRGLEVTGEVQWVQRTTAAPLVGITGTAGKGTVTSWVTHILNKAGIQAVAGGNIDPALSDVADGESVMVTELSSFQLERSTMLDARVAVFLNLGADHLDRHGTLADYHAAKKNLLNNQSSEHLLVWFADDPLLRDWQEEHHARRAGFSLLDEADAWLDGEMLMLHGQPLIAAARLSLKGEHNIANALATALTCFELGADREVIAAGLCDFAGLPGRFSTIATIGGVTFIEDSIATRPLSVEAALKASAAPVVWIAGGQNKGADIRDFRHLARERVSLFIGIGAAGAEFSAAMADVVPVLHVPEAGGRQALRRAVRTAHTHLIGNSQKTGTVLLAPLAASFDQFSDYQERGRVFREEVQQLEVSWTESS